MFAELGKTQSDVPQQSDGCKVFLCQLGLRLACVSRKTTEAACIYTGITQINQIFISILFLLRFY